MNVSNRQETCYFITFIYVFFFHYNGAFLIYHKYEAMDYLKTFAKQIQNKIFKKLTPLGPIELENKPLRFSDLFVKKLEFLVN